MANTPPATDFPKIQTQIAQLELVFKGPLVKNSMVDELDDLTTFNLNYNYEHKYVWVKSEQANYYLVSGDGSLVSHWKKHVNRLVIEQYVPNNTYQTGDVVYLSGRIFKAIQNVPVGWNPIDSPSYWLLIAGDSVTYRYLFLNQASIVIYSTIKNPIFEVIVGTLVSDGNGGYVMDTDGMIKVTNQQIVDANIKRRDDLPNNNGMAFEISFEANSLPIQLTGVINIK